MSYLFKIIYILAHYIYVFLKGLGEIVICTGLYKQRECERYITDLIFMSQSDNLQLLAARMNPESFSVTSLYLENVKLMGFFVMTMTDCNDKFYRTLKVHNVILISITYL